MGWADLAFSLRTGSNMGLTHAALRLRILVPRSSMDILNVSKILIYEAKIHVSLDSVTNVTKFSDQPLMLEKYSFHISYYVD